MYAVYHGPDGLRTIAERVNGLASVFAAGVLKLGLGVTSGTFFDTVSVQVPDAAATIAAAAAAGMNIRLLDSKRVGVAFDETK